MIECKDLHFSYDGRFEVLRGVDLAIRDGEFVCILGGNGSGKSTLAKHLDALLVPDAGTVTVNGMDTSDPELVYDIRSSVGMVFQNPDDQLVATLVEADVAFGPENLGVRNPELAQRVSDALVEVGLTGFEQNETHALSGGQKQRVAIAGALAMHPAVLVLDEASSMLDPRGRAGLMRVCRELNRAGMTIVMVTHYMEEAAEADRVVVLDQGCIALEGTPAEVFSHAPELARLNLTVPPVYDLTLKLRAQGMEVAPHIHMRDMADDIVHALGDGAHSSVCAGSYCAGGARTSGACTAGARTAGARAAAGSSVTSSGTRAAAADAHPLLALEHVWYSYVVSKRERSRRRRSKKAVHAAWGSDPDTPWALQDVCLTVRAGEVLGIAGHTGSGKSTLIRHLNGLLMPTRGRVRLEGDDLAAKSVCAQAKFKVGMVFQYPEHQLFAETVAEDVAFGPRNMGLAADRVDTAVRDALARVGLDYDSVAEKSPFELSGGQQRRVALAGVLAMHPSVLVLDEPAAGLDPVAHAELLELIEELEHQGQTVVMVSHNMDDLAKLCDRIVVLDRGSVALAGTPAEVFSDARALKRIGLGLPAAQAMAVELEERGVPLPKDRLYSTESLAACLTGLAEDSARDASRSVSAPAIASKGAAPCAVASRDAASLAAAAVRTASQAAVSQASSAQADAQTQGEGER